MQIHIIICVTAKCWLLKNLASAQRKWLMLVIGDLHCDLLVSVETMLALHNILIWVRGWMQLQAFLKISFTWCWFQLVGILLNLACLELQKRRQQLPQGATVVPSFKLWRQWTIAGELWQTCITFLCLKKKCITMWNISMTLLSKHRQLQVGKTATQPF